MALPPLLSPREFSTGTGGKVAANDPRVAPLLSGATEAVRRYCGWHVAPVVSETLTLDGDGGGLLALPTLRLVDVVSLTISGEPVDVESLEWSENGEIRGRFPDRFRSIVVEIEHGYESAADLTQIIQQVVANALSSPLGATREQAGIFSVSWATTAPGVSGGLSLLERDMAVLNSYRLPKGA